MSTTTAAIAAAPPPAQTAAPPPSSSQHQSPNQHAPYPPRTWGLGGHPVPSIDVPIMAVFLAFYLSGIVMNSAIFRANWVRGRRFLFSLLLSSFCSARTITCILRIASCYCPENINLLIATQVFVQAGVIPIYIINLFFSQRITRATHPHLGWGKIFNSFFFAGLFLILATLLIVIVALVQTFFTRDMHILDIDRDIMKTGSTIFVVTAAMPIIVTLAAILIPGSAPYEDFGTRGLGGKVNVLLVGSALIFIGALYRCVTFWQPPVPVNQPLPGYFNRAAFYLVNFTVEILVVMIYLYRRVDHRFYAPEGSLKCRGYEKARQMHAQEEVSRLEEAKV